MKEVVIDVSRKQEQLPWDLRDTPFSLFHLYLFLLHSSY